MPLTAIAFWVVYVSGVCTAVLYPVAGVALYVLVYHLNPETQWWGSSFAESGIRPSLTVAAATLLGILLRRPRLQNGARQFAAPIVLMLVLCGYTLLTLTWADMLCPRTAYLAEKIVKLAIFVLMLVRCVRKPAQQTLVLLAWLVGVAYIGYQAFGGGGYIRGGRLAAGLGGPDFAESSGLAVHLVATLPLLGALFFMTRSWWGRGLVLAAGALTVNTIIMTRTRSAVFGLMAMGFLALFWLPRGYRRKGLLAMLLSTLLAAQLTDPGWWNRMRTIRQYQQDLSATGRLVYWRAALDLAAHEPFGVGLGQFEWRVQRYTPAEQYQHSAHNTFLECLAETGFPGLALLLALVLAALAQLGRTRRASYDFASDVFIGLGRWRVRFHLAWHAMALQSALVGYLACGMFTTRLWAEGFWILIALSCSLVNVAADLRARAAAATSSPAYVGGAAMPATATPAAGGCAGPSPAGELS